MFTHLDRSLLLTGTLSPPILVNSTHVLKTSSFGVLMTQEININHLYMQGGPGKTVSEFKGKNVSGNISLFPRINESNQLESGVLDLISAAQNYREYVSLTSFLLPYNSTITPDNDLPFISSTNSLVFQYCLIQEITIKGNSKGDISISFGILGQTDDENTTSINLPNDETSVYRKLSWLDCYFERNGSQMENIVEFELQIKKELHQPFFLVPAADIDRFDRPYSTGVKSVEVNFKITENLSNLFDIFTYSLGGWFMDINFSGNFGPINFLIPNALLKISTQNETPDLITRITEGFYQMRPDTPETNNFLLTIS